MNATTANIANAKRPTARVTKVVGRSAFEGAALVFTVTVAKNAAPTSASFAWGADTSEPADIAQARYTNGVTWSQGQLMIPAGVTSFSVIVPTREDAVNEGNETVAVVIGGQRASAVIINDDRPAARVTRIYSRSAFEGDSLGFLVVVARSSVPTSASFSWGVDTSERDDYGEVRYTNGVTWHQGKLMIPAGVASFRIILPTVDDKSGNEGSESVAISVGAMRASATIINDDRAAARVTRIVGTNVFEGASLVFTVTVAKSSVPTAARFVWGAGSSEPQDIGTLRFTAGVTWHRGMLLIPAGVTSFKVILPTYEDRAREGNESVIFTIGSQQATGWIIDDDRPAARVTRVTSQGAYEGGNLIFTVTVTANRAATSASFAWGNDNSEPADIGTVRFTQGVTYHQGKLMIPAGVSSFRMIVPTREDAVNEGNESVAVVIGNRRASATILNDDRPAARVTRVVGQSASEGGSLIFTVTVAANRAATSARFAWGNDSSEPADIGTARFTQGVTYHQGSLLIPAGVTSFRMIVPTREDAVREANETVAVVIGTQRASATILNDDRPAARVTRVVGQSAYEGGRLIFTVTVTANRAATSTGFAWGKDNSERADIGTVSFTHGVTFSEGKLQIPAGVTRFKVIVPTREDKANEGNEGVAVVIGGRQAIATIVNDDRPAARVTNVVGQSAYEGGTLIFTVTVAANRAATSAVFAWGNDSSERTDFGAVRYSNGVTYHQGKLMIPAGVTSFRVIVPTIEDALNEGNETVAVVIGGRPASATIINDDRPAARVTRIVGQSASEGGNLVFTVTIAKDSRPTSARFAWGDDNSEPADIGSVRFTQGVRWQQGALLIPAGVTSFQMIVPTKEDAAKEGDEYVVVAIGGQRARATIIDDDGRPGTPPASPPRPAAVVTRIVGNTVFEGSNIVFTVSLVQSNRLTSARFGWGNDTSEPADIRTPRFTNGVVLRNGELLIPANVASFQVIVPTTKSDDVTDPNEDLNEYGTESLVVAIGSQRGVARIIDFDNFALATMISVSPETVSVYEGGDIVLTAKLTPSQTETRTFIMWPGDFSIDWSKVRLTNGCRLEVEESVENAANIYIPANVSSFSIVIPTNDDTCAVKARPDGGSMANVGDFVIDTTIATVSVYEGSMPFRVEGDDPIAPPPARTGWPVGA